MLYPLDFFERTKCSRNDKKQCIPVISRIISFSEKARREGLLALEEELDAIKDPFMQKGMQLVIDGTDPQIVQEILYTMMLSSHGKGIDLLMKSLTLEGILGIQSGYNPRIIGDKLSAFLGRDIDLVGNYDDLQADDRAGNADDADGMESEMDPAEVNSIVEGFEFEKLVDMRDIYIQKVLRETDTQDLAKALKGSSAGLREKMFSNMAQRAALLLKEDMQYMGPIRKEDAIASQEKILNITLRLAESGCLILPDGRELIG